MKDAFSILNQLDTRTVLDAATGRGEFINILKNNLRSYVQIIGVDHSDRMVDLAQKAFPENNVEIYQMNLESLRFEDSYFDLVSISNSLHHLEHPEKVLAELMRVLKPGGVLLILEMYRDGEQSEAQKTHILMHHWLASIDSKFGTFHRETFTRAEMSELIGKLKLNKLNTLDFYEPVDNPKEARNCESLRHNLEDTFKRLENHGDAYMLLDEGKKVLERINVVGCASPSKLLITGIKPTTRKKPNTKGDK